MKIVNGNYSTEYVIEKSRFISYAFQVVNIEKANEYIALTKKKHYDANHNCVAMIIGDNQEIMRSSDDGEPSGTAGVPILEVLKKNNITNTLIIVTRYFGGIKLGAGGLVRAYGKAATLVLDNAKFIKKIELNKYLLSVSYSDANIIVDYLKTNTTFISINYEVNVTICFATNTDLSEIIQNKLNKKIDLQFLEKTTINVDL